MLRQMQLRLVYSLLKPAVRCAARFSVPLRTAGDLLRLAMYEELANQGLSVSEIAERLGQTPRNARLLRQRLEEDFFQAEKQVGLPREIEDYISETPATAEQVRHHFAQHEPGAVDVAMESLLAQGRLDLDTGGQLRTGAKYVVLSSEKFHHRIDALNHHLQTLYRSLMERLVADNSQTAMMKTISFTAQPDALAALLKRLEGNLRQEIAQLEEQAEFEGKRSRFAIGVTATPTDD